MIYALLSFILLISCGPRIRTVLVVGQQTKHLVYDAEVFVYSVNEILPEGLKKMAQISLGDSFFTLKCNYESMCNKAIEEARKTGANVVKITAHKIPDFWSSCHRIKATLYKGNDLKGLEDHEKEKSRKPF